MRLYTTNTELDSLDTLDGSVVYVERDSDAERSLLSQYPPDDVIYILDHYGEVPAAVNLSVCRSWFDQAISDIKSKDHSNAPCLCDPPKRSLASPWVAPSNWTLAYTVRFIKDGKFYQMKEYGRMCAGDHHDCKEDQLET
jgi:hypothetical protein